MCGCKKYSRSLDLEFGNLAINLKLASERAGGRAVERCVVIANDGWDDLFLYQGEEGFGG